MRYLIAAVMVGLIGAGCKSAPMNPIELAQAAYKEVQKGDAALLKRDLEGAVKHYEAALAFTPNAPKFRFAYSRLLYMKALSYDQESHSKWQKIHGREFDSELRQWRALEEKLSKPEKAKMLKKSKENLRQALVYYNKCLEQLTQCDFDWNQAVELVPFAKGIVYFMMADYDNAVRSFNRVLESSRVGESFRKKIARAIKLIKEAEEGPQDSERRP